MTPRLALPLLAALACLAFAAPSASALEMTDYAVTVEGAGTYQRSDIGPGALGDWIQNQKAEFSWKSEIPTVTFIDKQAAMAAGSKITASVKSASMDVSIPTPEGPLTGACSGTTWQTPPSPGLIQGQMEQPEGRDSEGLWIRVLQGGDIKLSSCSGALGAGPYTMGIDGGAPNRLPPVHGLLRDAPRGDRDGQDHPAAGQDRDRRRVPRLVRHDRLVHAQVEGDGHLRPHVAHRGRRAGDRSRPARGRRPDRSRGSPDAARGADAARPPSGPSLERDDLDDLFIPMPGDSKLAPNAASATVTMLCPQGCRGTAIATLLSGGRARGAAAKKALAKKAFVAQAGQRTVVRLRFKPAARRAIKKAGGVKIALTATRDGGGAAKRTTLTLRRGR